MSQETVRSIEVLLVEDDEGDVLIAREGLAAGRVLNRVTVLSNGAEVLAYLRGEGEHAGAPRPDLILLDLNLPGRDGRQVLADIKGDPELRRIPVVVLTACKADEDVLTQLRPPRQRLRDQASRLRHLRRGRPQDRRLLPVGSPAAALARHHSTGTTAST